MLETLKEKTGKTLEEWKVVIKAKGLEKHGEILKFLKEEHGLTHGFANTISLKAREADAGSIDDTTLLETQYQGKESLKPIYDAILAVVKNFGEDVEVVPKKANVSLKTNKQFALVQPSTKTRVDLGIKLKGVEPAGRLETSGPFGTMCTHRIQLTDAEQVDDEVIEYLNRAYEASK